MAQKIKLTRPELKKQRDALSRFQKFLPMLKLKQQQLQMTMRSITKERQAAEDAIRQAQAKFDAYRGVLADVAGVDVSGVSECKEVKTSRKNVAGVDIPVFESISFEEVSYSLFATPAWVDSAVIDLREVNKRTVIMDILQEQFDLLQKELTKIIQRVNLFEKVKIPEAKDIIRMIKIKLSDEMAAAVGRAKIAKGKLTESDTNDGPVENKEDEDKAK